MFLLRRTPRSNFHDFHLNNIWKVNCSTNLQVNKDPRLHAIFMEAKLLDHYPIFQSVHLPEFLRSTEEDLVRLNIKDPETRKQIIQVINKTKGSPQKLEKKENFLIKTNSRNK